MCPHLRCLLFSSAVPRFRSGHMSAICARLSKGKGEIHKRVENRRLSTLLCARRAGETRPPRRRKLRKISHAILTENPFRICAKCVHGHIRTIKSGKNFRWFYDTFLHEIDIQQGAQTSVLLCVQPLQWQNEKSNFCIEQSYTVHCDITHSWL